MLIESVFSFFLLRIKNGPLIWSRRGWKETEICGRWDGGSVSSWETHKMWENNCRILRRSQDEGGPDEENPVNRNKRPVPIYFYYTHLYSYCTDSVTDEKTSPGPGFLKGLDCVWHKWPRAPLPPRPSAGYNGL